MHDAAGLHDAPSQSSVDDPTATSRPASGNGPGDWMDIRAEIDILHSKLKQVHAKSAASVSDSASSTAAKISGLEARMDDLNASAAASQKTSQAMHHELGDRLKALHEGRAGDHGKQVEEAMNLRKQVAPSLKARLSRSTSPACNKNTRTFC